MKMLHTASEDSDQTVLMCKLIGLCSPDLHVLNMTVTRLKIIYIYCTCINLCQKKEKREKSIKKINKKKKTHTKKKKKISKEDKKKKINK